MNLQGEKPMETDGSSPASSISEDSDWSITSQKIIDLQLLRKIIKIADCGQKVCKTSSCEQYENHIYNIYNNKLILNIFI